MIKKSKNSLKIILKILRIWFISVLQEPNYVLHLLVIVGGSLDRRHQGPVQRVAGSIELIPLFLLLQRQLDRF